MERKKLAPGVFITTLDAKKFNRCRITIHLRYPALRRSATDAAVLPLVLERGYAGCPDMTELSRKLARLYGADLGVDQSSAGIDRVLTVDICGIKDRFALDGENLTREYADIAFGTIFEPYLIDGVFDPEAVRIEKESLARRLFRNVREKQSLCYYCGSSALRATGVMMVDSGVEPGREAQAEAAILKELNDLCTGPITEQEMDDCRRSLLSSLDSLGDSLGGLESWYYGQILRDEALAPPEYGKVLTNAVTADEVREVLQSYHYSVGYTLTAKGEGENA